ncbi:MAG TPA: hypothetical protein VFV92_04105, partial [Candidatus Bathyarchaeia archaeon]|nr:hypothetical protein [Candidatus Bathyarchaeia archaeon]
HLWLMGAVPAQGSVRRTETVSYRVRPDLRSALEEEAQRLSINPNALVSQIFNRHISWGRYVGQLKFIPVSKDFLRLVFDALRQEQIENVAKMLGEQAAHEELLFLFQHITPGTILMFVDLWASHFDAWDHKYEAGKHVFTIKHDVNQGFSHFTKEYITSLLQSAIGTKVNFERMSPNSVTFTFEDGLRSQQNKPANNNRLTNNASKNTFVEVLQ